MSKEELPEVCAYRDEAELLLVPAAERQIVQMLTRLFSHYPQTAMSPELTELRWHDWLDDFSEVPPHLIEAACTQWRKSQEKWAPTPGQLLAKIAAPLKTLHLMHSRASMVASLLEQKDA